MPFTTNNSTDQTREDGDEADWARWEQAFRHAQPVLPEAAMARIEASIRREAERVAARKPSGLRRKIFLLVAALVAVNIITLIGLEIRSTMHMPPLVFSPPPEKKPVTPPLVEDHYSIDVPIGPNLIAPDDPILQVNDNLDWARGMGKWLPTQSPTTRPSDLELVKAAERLPMDGHHALGLLEMRRAAGVTGPRPPVFAPHVNEFSIGACWRLIPPNVDTEATFSQQLSQVRWEPQFDIHDGTVQDTWFWLRLLNRYNSLRVGSGGPYKPFNPSPREFPSHACDRARFDVLTELGMSRAQAALNVLTTRSYESMIAFQSYSRSSGRGGDDYDEKLLGASHDLFERLMVLRSMGRDADASVLVRSARRLRYLNDPQDMAVLLARLGPEDAWNKLLRPLMDDEANFINDPPHFDENPSRAMPEAIVQAPSKSTADGVATYDGPSILISAGPWRITCNKLSVFHNTAHGVLLSGSGAVQVHGVIGYLGMTADEVTFNTETGELKLAGRVHLDGWNQASDADSCTISRTGEVRIP